MTERLLVAQTQRFSDADVCTRRTLLGACGEQEKAAPAAAPAAAPPQLLRVAPEPESELIKNLLARTEANKVANDREVLEKTIKAGLPGTFGPLAKTAPVMKADGTFDVIPLYKYDKWKDQKKIVVSKTGLDVWAPGFDLDTVSKEPPKKFLGLF